MSDTADTRASADDRQREIDVMVGRIGGHVALDGKLLALVRPLLVSAAALAEEPFEGSDPLTVRQARADRALARLRLAAAELGK